MEINDQLAAMAEERDRLKRQERLLAELQGQLARERQKLDELRSRLQAEERDVSSLEGISLGNLFHTVLGDKDMRLEQERQEFLRAKLQYDEAASAVERLQEELTDLGAKLRRLPELEAAYAELLQRKEASLSPDSQPEALRSLRQRLAELNREQRELQEALAAGKDVLVGLGDVRQALDSAAGWGTWDMLGGGLISTMAKHSHMDRAREHAHRVEQALRRFHRELQDVAMQLNVDLQLDGFIRFADYFFDGLIVDWTVQNRINRSRDAVSQAEQRVRETMSRLESRRQTVRREQQTADEERQRLLARL